MSATAKKAKRADGRNGKQEPEAIAPKDLTLPLSDAELNALFEARNTPLKGRQRIQSIRSSLPGRATRTSRFAGKLRFASRKMGFVLEAEAFHTEFVALVEWEYDPNTLEIYSQPAERLRITYKSATSGKPITTLITPDSFRITRDGFVYTECKTARELEVLSLKQPARYVKDADGRWRSPPAEAAAAELGCRFELRPNTDNNYALFENLELLRDYLGRKLPDVPQETKVLLNERFSGRSFLSAFELIHCEPRIIADSLYTLLVNGGIYFPMHKLRLTEQEKALFFRSEDEWKAHEIYSNLDRPERRLPKARYDLRVGDTFAWNGVTHTVVNVGVSVLSSRALGRNDGLMDLSYQEVERLQQAGTFVFDRTELATDRAEIDAIIRGASREDLQEATWRYEAAFKSPSESNPLRTKKARTVFYWKRAFKQAEERWGNGFIGLLPKRKGNRSPKVSPATKQLAEAVIVSDWETIRRKKRIHSWGKYAAIATAKGLDTLSYQSFCTMIKERSGYGQNVARVGEKAAYELEPQYLELEQTTPRHGTHSWHIGHIDHTPLPLQFILGDDRGLADTIWLTILVGAFDRKIRAFYLSFDEPSYRSCMMVIRDCVSRHGRFFQCVVTDGGSEFQSAYYETLIAFMEATKRERLKGKPHYGSICERAFGTTQTQFVSNLLGSKETLEQHFRAISPEVQPERHAVWLLDKFDAEFDRYVENVYHQAYHTGLDMTPNEAAASSAKSHGDRVFRRRAYDQDFIALTCPAVHKGDTLVQAAGVKIKYRWFDAEVLHLPGVVGTRVPARYDPWNGGQAYVFVNKKWWIVRSERYAVFSKLTERLIRIATEAMRLVASKRGERALINARSLAQFLMGSEGIEVTARQKRNDAEAESHRAKVQRLPEVESTAQKDWSQTSQVIKLSDHSKGTANGTKRVRRIVEDL